MAAKINEIGIIGVGKVAKAFISDKVFVCTRSAQNQNWISSYNCSLQHSYKSLCENSKFIFLMVRPENLIDVLIELNPQLTSSHVIISVAAGVKITTMQNFCTSSVEIIRVMLNLQIESCVGTMAVACDPAKPTSNVDSVHALMSQFGFCTLIPESNFDVFTALAGSGPAFVYGIIEALAEGATVQGLPRDQAIKIATNMIFGSASHALINIEKYHPCQLREAVCTPGGSSIQGMWALENSGFRAAFINAIDAAVKKNIQFSKNYE